MILKQSNVPCSRQKTLPCRNIQINIIQTILNQNENKTHVELDSNFCFYIHCHLSIRGEHYRGSSGKFLLLRSKLNARTRQLQIACWNRSKRGALNTLCYARGVICGFFLPCWCIVYFCIYFKEWFWAGFWRIFGLSAVDFWAYIAKAPLWQGSLCPPTLIQSSLHAPQ